MNIDVFTHILNEPYLERIKPLNFTHIGLPRLPDLIDLDSRLKRMDESEIDYQVATMPVPPIEQITDDAQFGIETCQIINNAMADIRERSRGKIIPVGSVPLASIEASCKEAERAVKELGLAGILIYTTSGNRTADDSALDPFWETMQSLDRPIWIHPTDHEMLAGLKYGQATFGWPFATSLMMSYIILGGVFDRFPNLKFVTHHGGAMVPFLEDRASRAGARVGGTGGAGSEDVRARLKRPVIDYFRMFYVDTAVGGSVGAMHASYSFYGPDQIMFGTDFPFAGHKSLDLRRSVEALPIPPAQKAQIIGGNARTLLGL